MSKLSIAKAYIAWIVITAIAWLVSLSSGELHNLMSKSVELIYDPSSGLSRDDMILSFIVISLVYWLITIIVSGLFVFFTRKSKVWAKYLLTIFCIYQIYYEISSYFSIASTYDYTFGVHDWVLGLLSIITLLVMGILPHVKPQHSNS